MPARSRVVTGPVPLVGGLSTAHLGALVTADVLLRRARADGADASWAAVGLDAGLAAQWAAEEDLLREGLARELVGRESFGSRLAALAEAGRDRLASAATALRLGLDVRAAVEAGATAAEAARAAFVRLFDAGLIVAAERVVGTCPRCATTVGAPAAVPVELEGAALTLRLTLVDDGTDRGPDHLDVDCMTPELLPGVVGVAVPDGLAVAGRAALVPVAASVVPVVADPGVGAPHLLVPAHDPAALVWARRLGLPVVPVLDAGGSVAAPGPLAGLARYAARAAARQLLEAERVVVAVTGRVERAERCPACSTVLVPRLGAHWVLDAAELETAAADAVRDGRLAVWPVAAREEVVRGAGEAGEWCLGRQVWGGIPLPVGRCTDCGHVDVSVHPSPSCGRCMGDLVADDDVLDDRFVRCVWPLAAAGWPDAGRGPGDRVATLLVMPEEARPDVVAMVALALRLDGAVPFDEVAVVPRPGEQAGATCAGGVDGGGPVDGTGTPAARIALVHGGLDATAARRVATEVAAPAVGPTDVARLAEAMAGAFASADPAAALGLLAAAAAAGVPEADVARVRAMAGPFVAE